MNESQRRKKEFLDAYEAYADVIFRFCLGKVRDRERALDFMQETFKKAWEYAVKEEILNFKPFLFRVANNLIIDWYRRRKEESLDSLMDDGFDKAFEGGLGAPELSEAGKIREALRKLPKDYEEVIEMRFFAELSPKEIGDLLGETENAVSVRLNRAMKRLREILHIHPD